MCAPAPTRCAPLPMECSANTPGPRTLPWKRARPQPGQARLAACSLRQADLGDRLSRSHGRQVLQGRRRQLLAVGLGTALQPDSSPTTSPTPSARATPAKDWFFQEVPHSTTTAWLNPAAKDPVQPALRLGSNPSHNGGSVGSMGPRAGHHLDRQVQHGEGLARNGSPAHSAGRG